MIWHDAHLCQKGKITDDPPAFLKQEFLILYFPIGWFITTVILQRLQFSGSHQEHNCCLDNAFFSFLPLHLLKLIEWSGYMLLTSLDLISYFIKWEHRFANLSYYQARTFKNYNYIYYHYKSYWNTKEVESFNLRMNNKATIIKFNPRPLSLCLWL